MARQKAKAMDTDLYRALQLTVARGKAEPSVWVRRLVIYEEIAPEPKLLREVKLTKGLNIVWAEEPEDDDPTAEITGHSAGKTTFCRLLRYVLGEKAYGTKANMEMIQKALPGGYVGAELLVRQRPWAVIRPIGNGRNSYVKDDATLEELLADRTHPAYQDDYSEKVGLDELLVSMDAGAVARTDQPIKWDHLLAWCTRDQEARFQDIHEWRSPRSESEWPSFRFPKADPLFVMRAVLGLFLPDELKGEDDLAKLLQKQEKLQKRLEELKREPQFRVNLYDDDLRRRLRAVLPQEPDIDTLPLHSGDMLPDLHKIAERAALKIEADIALVEAERTKLQGEIDLTGAAIRQSEDELRQLVATFGVESAALREIDAGLSARQRQRQNFQAFELIECKLGGLLIKDCDYVKNRLGTLKLTAAQDAQALEQQEAKRRDSQAAVEKEKTRLETEITRLQGERQSLQTNRDALWSGVREKRDELRDLKLSEQQLGLWTERQGQPGEFKALDDCHTELLDTTKDVEKTEKRLSQLLEQHADNRKLLASIFSGAVKRVLTSGTYDGRVGLDNRELSFRITHGPAMSGEAVETLSVLLADVACLVFNSVSTKACLPGLLLHDSPREADLSLRIYRSFIRLVGALQSHFGAADKCPFQYILTTTTPPPADLQKDYVRLHLNAAVIDDLILRRNIAATRPPAGDHGLIS